jgi:hypothetical protein
VDKFFLVVDENFPKLGVRDASGRTRQPRFRAYGREKKHHTGTMPEKGQHKKTLRVSFF